MEVSGGFQGLMFFFSRGIPGHLGDLTFFLLSIGHFLIKFTWPTIFFPTNMEDGSGKKPTPVKDRHGENFLDVWSSSPRFEFS